MIEETVNQFGRRFGGEPRWCVSAPGRVNLIGEHVDYNNGFVLPLATQQRLILAAGARKEPRARFWSCALHEGISIELDGPIGRGASWSNYVRGVLVGYANQGVVPEGFDAVIHGDLPIGGGLSSSAALELGVATLIEEMTDHPLDPRCKALLCQEAEQRFAGVPCGLMDQFTVALSRKDHLMLLDCRSREVEFIPMTAELGELLIIHSNVTHDLKDGAYAQRREECETAANRLGVGSLRDVAEADLPRARRLLPERLYRRVRHGVTEIARTRRAAQALKRRDREEVGRLMYASHESLKSDFEVSCEELDTLVEIAKEIGPSRGVIGCRMTGGGFGGCAVALVQRGAVESVREIVHREYEARTGVEPAFYVSRPAAGVAAMPLTVWNLGS